MLHLLEQQDFLASSRGEAAQQGAQTWPHRPGGQKETTLHTAASTGMFVASPHSCQAGDLNGQVHLVPKAAASLLAPPEPLFEALVFAPHCLHMPYPGADHLVSPCCLSSERTSPTLLGKELRSFHHMLA